MALLSALLLVATAPETGATVQARATARILAAEEIDFSRVDAPSSRLNLSIRRIDPGDMERGEGVDAVRREYRLIEFR